MRYDPPFDYNYHLAEHNSNNTQKVFSVVCDSYVKVDAGTGIVHLAPGMGEDDFRVCLREGLIDQHRPETIPCYINDAGELTIGHSAGTHVKQADRAIIKELKDAGRVFSARTITHSYPFCYRTDTPLIQKAVSAWFINVHPINDRINQLNRENINWVPESVGDSRFANWLKTPHDWSFGRSRFWGTPVPLWTNSDYTEVVCVSSARELERLAGLPHGSIVDLHRQFIDSVLIPSQKQPGTFLKRIPDVFDCWFESGAMPYGKFAVENQLFGDEIYDMLCGRGEWCETFARAFPADFIGEGVDQTRGWFYTLLVLATILFDDTAYRNVIVNGLILSSDPSVNNGRWVKMSKRHKNYASPMEAMNKYGADALRLYMLDSPVTHAEALKFNESAILDKGKFLAQWYNCFQFLEQEIRMLQTLGVHQDARLDTESILSGPLNTYDNWILAELYTMVQQSQAAYDGYRLYQVVPLVIRFEELFSKWYINLSKLKMKGPAIRTPTPTSPDHEQDRALATLWKVLEVFSVIMSPITPFMSERIYQGLAILSMSPAHPSVHMVQLSELIPTIKFDKLASASASNLVDTVMSVRSLKTQAGQSARLKSRMLLVRHRDAGYLRDLQALETELLTAVKVAEVAYELIPETETVEYRVEFNKALIGKLAKGRVQEVLAELNKFPPSEFRDRTEITVCKGDFTIPATHWTITEVTCQADTDFLVDTRQTTGAVVMLARDIAMSPAEIMMEDLLKDIQRVKKQNGLKPENIATIYLRSPNPDLLAILTLESEYVAERLRSILLCGALPGVDMWNTHRLVCSVHVPGKWTYDLYVPGALPFMDPKDLIRL
jgi:isoleucyl-tRNA synthetase